MRRGTEATMNAMLGTLRCAHHLIAYFSIALLSMWPDMARGQDVSIPRPPDAVADETSAQAVANAHDSDAIVILAPEGDSAFDIPAYHESETFLADVPLQTQIAIEEAMEVPGIMGDPVKAVAFIPGVVSTGFGLFVHGSKEGESAVSMNHLPTGYLFHMGSLHSVMSPEAIDQLDAYLGGFDVTFGNAIGGVLDITPHYPEGRNSGYVHLGLLDSSLGFDYGLSDSLAFSLHARRSYIDLIVPVDAFDDPASETTFTRFPEYYDMNATLCCRKGDHTVTFETLLARDGFGFNTQENAVTDPAAAGSLEGEFGFTSAGLRWRYDDGTYRSNTLLGYLYSDTDLQLYDSFSVDMRVHTGTLYHLSTYEEGRNKWAVGAEVKYIYFPIDATVPLMPDSDAVDPDITSSEVFDLDETLKLTVYSLFVQDTVSFNDDVRMRLGSRVEDSDFGEYEPHFMPRGALVYDATTQDTLSLSAGLYSAHPDPNKFLKQIGNPDITDETATHYSAAWTHRADDRGTITVESYYKELDNLALAHPDDRFRSEGKGSSYGVSVSTTLRRATWDLTASCAWQEAERQLTCDDPEQYSFYGDVTHTLQLMASWRPSQKWTTSVLMKYATGQPYTPIIGTYVFTDTDGSTRVRPIHGEPYSERLPDYFTLNLRAARRNTYPSGRTLEWAFEIINATNHRNVLGIEYDDNYSVDGEQTGLPLMCSVDLTYRF